MKEEKQENLTQYSLKMPGSYHYAPMNIYTQVQTNADSQIIWLLEIHLAGMTDGNNATDRQAG